MAKSAMQIFRVAAVNGCAEQTQKALVRVAKREHARIMSTDPKPARFTRWVDGRQGAAEETVKPTGVIRYRYHRGEDVVRFAMETLFDLSPVESGDYRNAHTIFVNGASARNLAEWDGESEIFIANPLPYSRKIEIGKMKMRVPGTDHVYQQAEFIVHSRFGNQFHVVFDYRGIVNGAVPTGFTDYSKPQRGEKGRFTGGRTGGFLKNKSDLRFPALRIWARR